MSLFTDVSFFVWLGGLSVPAILLGIFEKPIKYYGMCVSLIFIWLAMGHNFKAVIYLAGFCVIEWALVKIYLKLRAGKERKAWIYRVFLILSIAPLAINKFEGLSENPLHIFGFLGISYMSFKAIQIIIEIYDGVITEISNFEFFYLLLFFPAIVSGPIDRSRRFSEDARRHIDRAEYLELLGNGIFKILLGMLCKIVLSAGLFTFMNLFLYSTTLKSTVVYMYVYSLYLFFDFAGYSFMAVGASYLFGVKTPENFKEPIRSKDIKDFWNRWHISLSTWFRDFVFSRFIMIFMKHKLFGKNKLAKSVLAYMINMTLMGVWHGLNASYILYGVYHGILLSLTEVYQKKSRFHKKHKKDKWYIFLEWLVTIHLVIFGFLIFSERFLRVVQAHM